MKKERDLLPWVLGGLSLAVAAVMTAVASAGKPLTPLSEPPMQLNAAQVAVGAVLPCL